ncbi:MFS transporter [Streptomyces purpurogeneiscleroticus]|uniref:MFS transporter n=1 Tax=Streptomyces purpurogeneiscleroticus TaxID=68259 RepID=UPI001CBD2AB9|nr:aromatic acid/H+ symport family MFS transporter [Streptomyces purpurogeneiscleroticus]MBZ4019437.1 MFS transporter [Streptomyces purpurogeneiscleroticus]
MTLDTRAPAPSRPRDRALTWAVIALCTAAITVEGFDLIVYGVALPAMLADRSLALDASLAGTLGSLAYAGMLVGALVCGPLADRLGRRRLVLASGAVFTVFTVACALAAAPWQFGLFRLLAGIGMGGVMPSCVALTKEYAPRGRSALAATAVLAGIPVGGVLAALTASTWGAALGWRGLFAVGAALSAAVVATAYALLPDSRPGSAAAPGKAPEERVPEERAPEEGAHGIRTVLSRRYARNTLLFTVANFAVLLAWYGLNTWLTQLMRELDYPLGSALRFTLVLNLGAVVGSFVLAALADRVGPRPVTAGSAALAALAVLGLSQGGSTPLILALTALAGVGAQSALTMLNDWVATGYPAAARATALGCVSGFGRGGAIVAPLLGGWILQAALGPATVFYVFAAAAFLCTLALLAVRVRA